jgi:outer membrane protein assembly factor BamB
MILIRAIVMVPSLVLLAAYAQAQQANDPLAAEWPAYRYNTLRTGVQPFASDLSDPNKVGSLAVKWTFSNATFGGGSFKASPIVAEDTVFIGSDTGHFFALDAATGKLKWQFPEHGALFPPVSSHWDYGIWASAAYWHRDGGAESAVIVGAQDPSLGQFGSARLFALGVSTGKEIWRSDPIAIIDGITMSSLTEHHERLAYSPPLIFNDKVYVGVADNGDNPIQFGRVVAVDLKTGHIDKNFKFRSVGTATSPPGTRGGGVWNGPAGDGDAVYFTTGNTRQDGAGIQDPEPQPNHGLSMVRVNKDSGDLVWAFQPVPYKMDLDPDWAAGASVMATSCGKLIASVQKDGWAYAVRAGDDKPAAPDVKWQFPPTGFPFTQYVHSDTHYKRPGAAWNDVLVISTGGESLPNDGVTPGYTKLHALNACADDEKQRVRWIADIPNASGGYALGAPSVTGGIVFVGTNTGHLIVLADPSIVPNTGWRCSNIDYTTASTCTTAGYVLVPVPKILANVAMPDNGSMASVRSEVALAKGRAFVATSQGHVYMLAP